MKVVMLKDVPKVGRMHEVKEFSDGYANNVLISKGLAEKATPQVLAKLEAMKASAKKKKEEENKKFAILVEKLNDLGVTISAPSNEKGNLFKAINAKDVANEVYKLTGEKINEGSLVVGVIKQVGEHQIKMEGDGVEGTFSITIK